jgi:hypothetical protein
MNFKRKIFLPLFFLLLQTGCNNESSVERTIPGSRAFPNAGNSDTLQIVNESVNCYRYVIKRDTILLQVRQRGDSISGTMSFDNYEKDSSHGAIKGYTNKDTIYVLYNFFSEGMRSIMEIALLKNKSSLIRGIGAMINKGDTLLYKDHKAINYKDGQKLDMVNCDYRQ